GILSGSFITNVSPTAQCSQRILQRLVTVISTLVNLCFPYLVKECIASQGSLAGDNGNKAFVIVIFSHLTFSSFIVIILSLSNQLDIIQIIFIVCCFLSEKEPLGSFHK